MFEINDQYTASNHYISALYHLAENKGLDGIALLKRAGIEPQIIDSADQRVETQKLATVLQLFWDSLEDENMGLTNSPCRSGTYYMMGKLTVHQLNLGKALELGFRYYGFMTDGFELSLAVKGDIATVKINLSKPELDRDHLLAELTLLAWHRYASWLIDEDLPLTQVYFNYPAPKHVREYVYLFPGSHRFQHSFLGFSFHKKYLERETLQTETALKTFMSHCPAILFLRKNNNESLTHNLQLLLKKQVNIGLPDLLTTANSMHMSKRTLMRKLKQEGTSYQQIKDLVRRDTAIFFLTQQHISIAEIAEEIGYSDPAVFARAFKTWTGLSPAEYRLNTSK